jgi:hypothetical protein
MEKRADVVIISAFGRGHWLASEMGRRKVGTILIDVSNHLGHWNAEDWDGPFGVLKSSHLKDSHISYLSEECHWEEVQQGYTFWFRDGPFELNGPLSDFWRKKNDLPASIINYLSSYESKSSQFNENARQSIERLPFRQSWLAHYAHQISSSRFRDNFRGMNFGSPAPILSPFFIRRLTRRSVEEGFNHFDKNFVKVFSDSKLIDLSIQSRRLDGLEISSYRSGFVPGRQFIWMLTGEETQCLNKKMGDHLFDNRVIHSDWSWIRYRIKMEDGPEVKQLPLYFALIKDMRVPWTHGNLLLAQRSFQDGEFDVWSRIPSRDRFEKRFLDHLGLQILEGFKGRMPAVELGPIQMPLEYRFSYEELGPPRFPVYSDSGLDRLKRFDLKNIIYSSPEDWESLDWQGQFKASGKVLKMQSESQKVEKGQAIDRPIHP